MELRTLNAQTLPLNVNDSQGQTTLSSAQNNSNLMHLSDFMKMSVTILSVSMYLTVDMNVILVDCLSDEKMEVHI